MTPTVRDFAEECVRRGWVPVPVQFRGKAPIGAGWQTRAVEDVDLSEFDNPVNVGLLLGGESKLVDIDLDCAEAVLVADRFLPPTLTYGRASRPKSHRLFVAAVGKRQAFSDPTDKGGGMMLVELRGDGCQSVAPPSIHESGEEIRFYDDDDHPEPISIDPAVLIERVRYLAIACVLGRHWAKHGTRHDAGLALVGGLLSSGVDPQWVATICEAVCEIARDDNAKSIWANIDSTQEKLRDSIPCVGWTRLGELIPKAVVNEVRGWLPAPKTIAGKSVLERGDHVEVAAVLLSEMRERAPTHGYGGEIWRYRHEVGTHARVSDPDIAREIGDMGGRPIPNGKSFRPLRINHADIGGIKKLLLLQADTPDFMDRVKPAIAFSNRTYVLGEGWCPHAPDNYAITGFPFEINETPPTQFLSFLTATFGDDADEQAKIECLQMFAGLALFGLAPACVKRAIVFSDEHSHGGHTGKSTLLNIMIGLMPEGMTTHIPPTKFVDRFAPAMLVGSLLNAVNELPLTDFEESDKLKEIITGERILAERKYRDPFYFSPKAGHIFATNALMGTRDTSHGFWRRFVVVGFDRAVDPALAVPNLHVSILNSERASIVNWAILGAEKYFEKNSFTIPESSETHVAEWRSTADSVGSWITLGDMVREDWTPVSTLYTHYSLWCRANGYKEVSLITFGKKLKSHNVPTRKCGHILAYLCTAKR